MVVLVSPWCVLDFLETKGSGKGSGQCCLLVHVSFHRHGMDELKGSSREFTVEEVLARLKVAPR
jgi:hypothetical protein